MNWTVLIVLIVPIVLSSQKNSDPKTVSRVDLKRYVGLWYEVAKIPNSFQEDCAGGTTAEYKLMENGNIQVINACIEADGEKNTAEGVVQVVDKKTNAKLEVSFFSILGIRPFWGDYWIIGLDDDYQYAVIGHPERKYGWILSRKQELSEVQLNEVYNILKSTGYDKNRFQFTKQKMK